MNFGLAILSPKNKGFKPKSVISMFQPLRYDAEVEDVPSVQVLPLGSKADGTTFDKTDMVTVKAPNGEQFQVRNIFIFFRGGC